MNKIMLVAIITVTAISGFIIYSKDSTHNLNGLALANLEALTDDNETHTYESRNTNTISIWDDEAKIYKSITIIDCNGKGEIVCP